MQLAEELVALRHEKTIVYPGQGGAPNLIRERLIHELLQNLNIAGPLHAETQTFL